MGSLFDQELAERGFRGVEREHSNELVELVYLSS